MQGSPTALNAPRKIRERNAATAHGQFNAQAERLFSLLPPRLYIPLSAHSSSVSSSQFGRRRRARIATCRLTCAECGNGATHPTRNPQHSGRESRRTVNSRLRLKDTFHRSRPLSTSCRGQAPSRTNTRQDNFKTTVTSPGPPSFGPRHPCTLTLLRY